MNTNVRFLRRNATRLVAIALTVALYGLARLPELSDAERAALAARFHFTPTPVPEAPGFPHKSIRTVHPSLERISAWISSVGAAAALADLDGDGLPNDLCLVDPRTDLVTIVPVPDAPARYQPFALHPAPLPYDPATMAPMGCLTGDLNEDGLLDLLVYYWGRTPIAFLHQGEVESVGHNPRAREDRDKGDYGVSTAIHPLTLSLSREGRGDPKAKGKEYALSRNRRLETGSYVPYEISPSGERWYTDAATLSDLDGDGHVDLIIGNYFQDGGRILDAQMAGVEVMHDTKSKSFNGGWNRLLLWAGATSGTQPSVRFTEIPGVLDEEVARGWTLALGAADLDGDLLPEIYFANDFGPDRLLYNRSTPGSLRFAVLSGTRKLTTPASFVFGRDSFKGMGTDFGDLNGDGLLDIYVSNIATEFGLQESHFLWLSTGEVRRFQEGVAPYVQASEALGLSRSGWGWESRLADFDNDGMLEAIQATGFVKGEINRWPELQALGTGNDQLMHDPRFWPRFRPGDDLSGHEANAFFVRAGDGRYYNLARELGLDEPVVSRGIATADVDGDGDLDFVEANQWAPSVFYRNDCPQCRQFLGLHVLLPLPAEQPASLRSRPGHPGVDTLGRPAIGAAATVHLPDGRRLAAQVDGGNGHSGKRSADLHFGLGQLAADARLQVELRWRDPQGQAHHSTLSLTPGWHTIVLGAV